MYILYLHDSFNPSSLVIVFKAHDSGMRNGKVSIEQIEMVSEHDEEPTWDQ